MYASNIPVILVAAVLANVRMSSLLFWQHPEWHIVGHASWIGAYPDALDHRVVSGQIQRTTPIGGLAYYFSNVNGVQDWLLPLFNPNTYGVYLRGLAYWQGFLPNPRFPPGVLARVPPRSHRLVALGGKG